MGDLFTGPLGYSPGCRFFKNPPAGCRHMRVQEKIFRNPIDATTRLADHIPAALKLKDVRRNTTDVIKGLFILPMIGDGIGEGRFRSCFSGLPLIVFGRPEIQGQKADYQHKDLAQTMNLVWRRKLTPFESEHYADGSKWGDDELQPGIWGFVLAPLTFKADSSQEKTRIVNPQGEHAYMQEIHVDALRERGLVNAKSGAIDLEKVKGIELPTASELRERQICAYLMRATRQEDREVWAVYARSVFGGVIPDLALPIFLQALAHHVAPEFIIFQFITNGTNFFYPNAIKPFWREAVFPSCLKWPYRMRLLKRITPPKSWWGQ